MQLLRLIRTQLGDNALELLIDSREQETRDQYCQAMVGVSNVAERVERLVAIRTGEGYMAQSQVEADGTILLIENHCPIWAAAASCQRFAVPNWRYSSKHWACRLSGLNIFYLVLVGVLTAFTPNNYDDRELVARGKWGAVRISQGHYPHVLSRCLLLIFIALMHIAVVYSGLKVISTRRFCALPAAVLLDATGLSGPAP